MSPQDEDEEDDPDGPMPLRTWIAYAAVAAFFLALKACGAMG